MNYRPEIDGLRALAVLPVFLFHLGIYGFSGGFVGVDIFFVISGYLITSIIWNDLEKGTFSFSKFYERRVRRIIPALYLVLAFSWLFTFLFFMDDEFKYFCRSTLSTLLFYSNIQFWNEAGYFDLKSHMKPLLHTWSLSIEEQFYIVFPTLLILLRKFMKKYTVHLLSIFAIGSFAFDVYVLRRDSNSAFYFMHLRAWELLLGCLLALKAFPKIKLKGLSECISFLGLVLIVYSIVWLDSKSKFPGFNALIPCVGTALIIYCSSFNIQTNVAKFLSNRIFVFVGKISYSLYLWHWPLIVFTKYWVAGNLSPVHFISILAIGFLLSFLSWKYLEQPIRMKSGFFKKMKPLLLGTAIATTCLCIFSVIGGFVTDSFPSRLPQRVLNYSKGTTDTNPMREKCHDEGMNRVKENDLCELGISSGQQPQFIVWGDSHADALFPAFDLMAKKTGSYGLYASLSSCTPLMGVVKKGQSKCYEFNNLMIEFIRKNKIKNVVLVANWHPGGITLKKPDEKKPNDENEKADDMDELQTVDKKNGKRYTDNEIQIFKDALESTITNVEQVPANAWFLATVPRSKFEVSSVLGRYESFNRDKSKLHIKLSNYKETSKEVAEVIQELKKQHVINVIDPTEAFCSDETGKCIVEVEGKPLYRDQGHLTTFGSTYVAPALLGQFFDSINMKIAKKN